MDQLEAMIKNSMLMRMIDFWSVSSIGSVIIRDTYT